MSTSESCKDSASKSSDDGVCEVIGKLQNMSTADKDNEDISYCANCGKGEEESNKLKACTACKMVKYCSRECQIAHRSQHKKACRKRAAELHDIELFKEPPPREDCPICFMTIPLLKTGYRYNSCCGKVICSGCAYAPVYDNQGNKVDSQKCAFCRTPKPTSEEEANGKLIKRVEAGDLNAIYNVGVYYQEGMYGYPQNYTKALEYWHKAAELGNASAYSNIGFAYRNGNGVEFDNEKVKYYYELAAMRGSESARHSLGFNENSLGNIDRALKHWMIAVRSGHSESLAEIKELYSKGHVTKENYMTALQSYQAYLSEIKSAQRDKAAAADEDCRYY